jgi:imidazolonepropionase-like amidohydrolase
MNFVIRVLATCLTFIGIASAQTTAITGATVHTVGPQGASEDATIIIEGGRIGGVGSNIPIPANAERIDASGKIITPGLFSPLGQIGLSEVNAVEGTNDATQTGVDFTAGFDVADAFNPRSIVVAITRIDGITRAGINPRAGRGGGDGPSSHVLSGLGSVVHLGDSAENFVKRGATVVVNFGEAGSGVAGGSRAAAVQILRTALDDAIDYRQNKSSHDRGDWRDYSVSAADLDALQRVMSRDAAMGGSEAWMVADHLAAANVPVILDGINNLPGNFERINARLDSASVLVEAGVTVSFGAAAQTHNARLLTQSAGIAVANGLTWEQALEAVTLAPARILGVDSVVGSIVAGKEADLVVWSADPLEITSYPDQVYIQGAAVSMESRQTLLRDRYLQTDSDEPPAFRN